MNGVWPVIARNRPPGAWHLLVDLSLLRPGGENGGIRPFVFENLRWLGQREGSRLTITFLTWSCSHADVRTLARPWDNLVCVRHDCNRKPDVVGDWRCHEWFWPNPPPHLAVELDVDLIYSPQSSPEFFCPGIPAIATVVDLLHRDYPSTLAEVDVAHRERLFTQLVRTADAFQCISDFTCRQLQCHYGVGPDRAFRNYIAVHHRLDLDGLAVDADIKVRPYFLYPANAWPHKNHLTLLVAYNLYRARAGSAAWGLVLTGHNDSNMRVVLATATALGLGSSVRYQGHLDDLQFRETWKNASALVFPSLHEGFGIPLVEAMHFGVPILCSRETSLPEIAGSAALLVDARKPSELAEAMLRMSGDAALRSELIAKGRCELKRFSMEAEGQVFLDHCQRLLGNPTAAYTRGWHHDGWTEPVACVGLPKRTGPATVELEIAPMPAARRFRIYEGRMPLGEYSAAPAKPQQLGIVLPPGRAPLIIQVLDADNLNPSDHRVHGILLSSVCLVEANRRIPLCDLERS